MTFLTQPKNHLFTTFYSFLSTHSFLIGLFQILLPSYLWSLNIGITKLLLFISLSGLGFLLSLLIWERLYSRYSFQKIIIASFIVQILFMSTVFLNNNHVFLLLLALLNGAYNCFFWITQRALFFDIIDTNNSGKNFGNFQIYVAILLNLSLSIGAFLLENNGFFAIYLLSIVIVLFAIFLFSNTKKPIQISHSQTALLTMSKTICFNDKANARWVFFIDGIFLYLESYFWVISLFLIAHESFLKLGMLIISLAVLLAIVFYVIKNIIDKIGTNFIYNIGVFLYGLSWFLRTQVEQNQPLIEIFLLLIFITFSTAFFRLSFNKRFFDIAKKSNQHQYLLIKSYQSQLAIFLGFLTMALLTLSITDILYLLHLSYLIAVPFCLCYYLYKDKTDNSNFH